MSSIKTDPRIKKPTKPRVKKPSRQDLKKILKSCHSREERSPLTKAYKDANNALQQFERTNPVYKKLKREVERTAQATYTFSEKFRKEKQALIVRVMTAWEITPELVEDVKKFAANCTVVIR